jgi:hypothetical protein
MSETTRSWREDLKVFRERMGGLTEENRAAGKDQRETLKAITEALRAGPRTVPEIAGVTRLPAQKVMWYVMAMKRYGSLAEVGRAGDYLRYGLKEAEP